MPISVRDATVDDHPAVGAVTVAAYRADGQLDGEHGYEQVLADVAGRAAAGDVLVATDDGTGEVLGAALVVLPGARFAEISRAQDAEVEFRMLAVAPTAQRRGVGRALVEACLRRAGRYGARAAVICVRGDNPVALHLYTSVGFLRIPERDHTPVPGVRLHALRLTLPTPPGPA